MKRSFCTYFDNNYLIYGLTMFRSLKKTGMDFQLFVLCLDDVVFEKLASLDERVTPIRLSDLESYDRELLACKNTRSIVEYYFTISPCLPLYLFHKYPELEMLAYLDSDLYFFSSSEPVFEELGEKSLLIFEHDFSKSPEQISDLYGRFNVAFQIYRNNKTGLACLNWWRERCLEWCYDRSENGKFADQKYLDYWPELWGNEVIISKNSGANLAPWNMKKRDLRLEGKQMTVNGQEPLFIHYQGFKIFSRYSIYWPFWNEERIPITVWKYFYNIYFREILKTRKEYPALFVRQAFVASRIRNIQIQGLQFGRAERFLSKIPTRKLQTLCRILYAMLRRSSPVYFIYTL